jgi:hypothetical protein
MRAKLLGLLLALMVCLLAAASAWADKLVCVSNEKLRGQETIGNCLEKGEKFAIVDENGGVRILSRQEFELMKSLNPKLTEMKAYGIIYLKEAPQLKKLPPMATPKKYQ